MKEANVTFWETLRRQKSGMFYYTWATCTVSFRCCLWLVCMHQDSEASAQEPWAQVGPEETRAAHSDKGTIWA